MTLHITNSGLTFDSYAYGSSEDGMFCVATSSITVEKDLFTKLTGYIVIIDKRLIWQKKQTKNSEIMNIKTLFINLINSLLDGSFERVRIISQMNAAFKEYFTTGEFNRLCKVSISQGNSTFAHEMSTLWIRSGFKISIENDASLKDSEINELATYVTDNAAFVRQLMAIGFDTLTIKGKTTGKTKSFALKRYANLDQYFIS